MFTEEDHAGIAAGGRVEEHEEAAHQKRNWVRLTYDCNDNCIFCLDSDTHDGEIRALDEVKRQILDGRRKGAERLILSGGEPTIHPRFVDFVKLGRLAGYAKIQTVTNGRMFRYKEFLTRAIDAGLGEITFSIHGHNAKVHDALVGVKGAFEQEVEGLKNALDDGRVIVNIDVCVNRGNVKSLSKIIEKFVAMGVREYDLLHVIPFGRAYTDGRDTLFYDLSEMREHLVEAFRWSKEPDMHIWLNRFPVEHCEGFEDLIQDPYKLNDEIRGRKEEYARWIERGEPLDCREKTRCGYCYLERVCDHFEGTHAAVTADRRFDVVRVDTTWDAAQGPIYGGDPASARRAKAEQAALAALGEDPDAVAEDGRRRLPLLGQAYRPLEYLQPEDLAATSGARRLHVVAPMLADVLPELERFPGLGELSLELSDYAGLAASLTDGAVAGRRLVSCVAATTAQAEQLLAVPCDFEVVVLLTRETAPFLLGRADGARIVLRQPTWERLTESSENDVDLRAFFAALPYEVPVERVPACVTGRAPREEPRVLDTTMLEQGGRLEMFRYIKRFILDHYFTQSLRCRECVHAATCHGMHVNYVRAHGFQVMQPVADPSVAAAE